MKKRQPKQPVEPVRKAQVPRSTADILTDAAETYRIRNKVYGDNFLRVGTTMHAMFPNGITINSADDWTRLYFIFIAQVKFSRYITNWSKRGHKDSIHDAMIYSAMLEMFDERIANGQKKPRE